jgi:dipeptidyl aminopeptidase/acylaminoacyl peptidase
VRDQIKPALGLGTESAEKTVHCRSEEIRYKTFDGLSYQVEGEQITGEIMATLYTPNKPAPPDQMKGLVRSFYGGSLSFDMDAQVLCAMGYTVLSPAPRGDASISSAFEKLNDGDMGGKEIVDIIYGGKFLAEKTGIPSARIGAFGHSHGGFAAMRLVTFPGEVDGVEANFDWGFAIANSGFGNIVEQSETSNIPGWTRKEAGDVGIVEIRQKFLDRSPINHLNHLQARLLLVHGDVDQRVPYPGSKSVYDGLVTMKKANLVDLVTIPGMGHVPMGEQHLLTYYGAWIDFLK